MTTTYTHVALTEAQAGDELLQAGEWATIESVHFFRDMAKVFWVGGGSATFPAHFHSSVRRAVPALASCPDCSGRLVAEAFGTATYYARCTRCGHVFARASVTA